MRKILVSLAVLWMGFSAGFAHAEPLTVCVAPNGTMYQIGPEFNRQKCNKGHRLKTFGGVPHLFDANGQDLGVLLDHTAGYFKTFNDSPQKILEFENCGNFATCLIPQTVDLLFEESNCQGIPHARLDSLQYIRRFGGSWTQYWVYNRAGEIKSRSFVSAATRDSRICVPNLQENILSIPLQEISLPFTEPLAWPLEVRVE